MSNEKSGDLRHQCCFCGVFDNCVLANAGATNAAGGTTKARRPTTNAPGPEPEFAVQAWTRFFAARRRSQRRDSRALYFTEQCLSRYTTYLLGVCSNAV